MPRADLIAADPEGLAVAALGFFGFPAMRTREMKLRLLFVLLVNEIDLPEWLVNGVIADAAQGTRRR